MRKFIHKLFCFLGFHQIKHDYTVFTESTVTIVVRCIHCPYIHCKTDLKVQTS